VADGDRPVMTSPGKGQARAPDAPVAVLTPGVAGPVIAVDNAVVATSR